MDKDYYYCNTCDELWSEDDDLDEDGDGNYMCPECGSILELCDGTI